MSILKLALSAAFFLLSFSGCSDSPTGADGGGGGGGNPPSGSPSVSLSLSGSSVNVTAGGSATTTVTVQRGGGYTGAVNISVAGTPAGVTASVSPSSIPQGSGSAVITWTAVASAPPGGHSVTVSASGTGTNTATATLQLSVVASNAVPSALERVAGDGQSVAAGTDATVKPAVRVVDDRGQPVSGVSVVFSVDTGSSVIGDSVVTSGSDGRAVLGSWNVGPGRNVLKASSGALPPVRFVATGTGEMTVASTSIPAGGGTLTVSRKGDPLDGMKIAVAPGSYAGSASLDVSYGSDASSAPKPRGMRIISPVVTISGAAGFTLDGGGVLLDVPATFRKNEWPVALLFDKATGRFEAMPSGYTDTTHVLAVTRHLDGSYLNPSPTPASVFGFPGGFGTHAAGEVGIQMVIGAVPLSDLAEDIDTEYRSQSDDWDFDPAIIYDDDLRFTNAWPLSAAWYFDHFKAGRGNLSKKFRRATNVSLSNSQGLRLGSELTGELKASSITAMSSLLEAAMNFSAASRDSLVLLNIKAGMYVTGRPQLLLGTDGTGKTDAFVLVYRTRGSTMDVTLGTNSPRIGAPGSISLTGGNKLGSMTWKAREFPSGGDVTFGISSYIPTGQTVGINAKVLNAAWQKVFNGTAGDGIFPAYHFATEHQDRLTDTIWLPADTATVWLECEGCDASFTPGARVTPTHGLAGAMLYEKSGSGWTSVNDRSMDANGLRIDTLDAGKYFGAVAYYLAAQPDLVSYLDWAEFVIARSRIKFTPVAPETPLNEDLTISGTLQDRALPASATWTWELGDGRILTERGPSITFKYPEAPAGGKKYFEVTAKVFSQGELWASGKVKVNILGPEPYWIIETFDDPRGYPTTGNYWYTSFIASLRNNPSSGLIAVREDTLGQESLTISFHTNYSSWDPASCCDFGQTYYMHFGTTEGFNVFGKVIGPFFSKFGSYQPSSKWSQSDTDLDKGTMTGVRVFSILPFLLVDLSTQDGPIFSTQFQATREGKMLTGTFKFLEFDVMDAFIPSENLAPDIHTFSFTARRVR